MPANWPRCQVLPLPNQEVSFQIEGRERIRWHFGGQYPRPFFYPLLGPSGISLTRMGHPGDYTHDHHRSIWFAHHKVLGLDFWTEESRNRIRQKRWLDYHDSDEEAVMASLLGWFDHQEAELLEQELVAAVRPGPNNETFVEIQATFRPTGPVLALEQTNFGLFAVRVAKHISAHFGGGELRNSAGQTGEPAIFGQVARWMDYSGPVLGDRSEGITYFDHPRNPGQPTKWHVRADGWMGASVCRDAAQEIRRDEPWIVRYLLHAHAGALDVARANEIADQFAQSPNYVVEAVRIPHQRFQIRRA